MKKTFVSPLAGELSPRRAGKTVGAPLWTAMALLVTFFLAAYAPGVALAEGELEGEITLGAQMFDIDHVSAHFGKFNGVDDKGTFLVGELELEYSKDLFFFELEGKDLGLDSRMVKIELGQLGGYELKIKYNQSPWLISSDSKTIYDGAGSNTLTLPAGFKPGNQTKDMVDQLTAAAKDIKLRVNRNTASAEFDIPLGDFLVDVRYSSENRKGEVPLIGALGISGGNNRAVDLPGPVDYTTNDMTVALFWKSEMAFAKVDFSASTFDNANEFVLWDNPFPTTVSGVNYPKVGKTSLPPSNTYQRIGVAGGLKDLPGDSAISVHFDTATSKQDHNLLDYSYNSNSTVATAMPRGNSGAEIDVTDYAIKANTRPIDNLGIKLEYRNYTTKNKTPSDLWIYVPLDSGVAQDGLNGSHALYNLPVDHAKTDMKADLTYTIMNATTISLGYLNEVVDRTYREVAKTKEDKISAGLTHKFDIGKFKANYSSSSRKIDGHYDEAAVFDAYHTHEYVSSLAPNVAFDDHPLMRKFDIAARDRTQMGASLFLWPSENLDLSIIYSGSEDKYGDSEFGLVSSKGTSATVDVTFRPANNMSLFAYYTSDAVTSEQASRAYSGAAVKAAQSVDPTRNWWATHDDKTPTIGAGAVLTVMDDQLDIGAYYANSDATSSIKFRTGGGLGTILDMPDLKTKLTSIDVTAKYRFSEAITLGLGYAYETYENVNWSLDKVEPASAAILDVITMVPIEPDFKASKAMVFIVWSLGK